MQDENEDHLDVKSSHPSRRGLVGGVLAAVAAPAVLRVIPAQAQSVLGPLDPETAGRIRGFLLRQLSK